MAKVEISLPGMKHLTRFFLTGISILFLAFFTAKPALAMEFRSSDAQVVVSENEIINGSLFAGGNTVEINGVVDGDLFCAGQTITIKGTVAGDVLCVGQTIRIEGAVGGNIRSIGQTLDIEGSVERNVMVMGQSITLGAESTIAGEAILGGQNVMVAGDITKSLLGAGNSVNISGLVSGNATVYGNMIQVGNGASVMGKLTYASEKDIAIADGARVGEIVRQPMSEKSSVEKQKNQFPIKARFMKGKPWPASALPSIIAYIVIGILGVLLFKDKISKVLEVMKAQTGASFGVGLVWLCIFPVLFIMLLVTIIGIPIAFLYALVFAFVLSLSKLFAAIYIGKEILLSFWKDKKENWYLAVVIGVVVSWLVFSMPIIGGLCSFLAMLWGAGGLVKVFLTRK